MERRRFVGPEGSVKPIKSLNSEPSHILNTETLTRVHDGRFPEQMRSFLLRPSVISQAKGSCYLELKHQTDLRCLWTTWYWQKSVKRFLIRGTFIGEVDFAAICF